ncbi:hypothetical protein HYV43_05610 [Candidatus Micrarchaeota archaeon]|nr:hypothetical protein [Candidatus Micrarchaeota archaeon]
MWSLLLPLLFSAAFFGFFRRRFDDLPAVGLSAVAGFLAFSWFGMAGYWFFGLDAGFALSAVASVAAFGLSAWRFGLHAPRLASIFKHHRAFCIFLALAVAAFSYLSLTHFVQVEPDGWYSSGNTWGDLPFHLGVIHYFVFGQSFPPAYVIFDSPLGYPFMADFSTALLMPGASLQAALLFSALSWFLALMLLSYAVGLKMGFSKSACVLALVLLLSSGGLGFIDFPAAAVRDGIGSALMAKDYTILPPTAWTNVVTSLLLPQRTLLFGAAVFAAVLFLLLHASRRHDFLLAGALAGLLPLVHWHSYLAAMGVAVFYAVSARRKVWLWFFLPAVLLALPQLAWSLQQLTPSSLIHLQPNWTANAWDPIAGAAFWLMQTGFWIPALLFGLWSATREQRQRFLPFGVLFVLAAFVSVHPYAYDNLKFFFFVQWAAAFFIAAGLVSLWQRKQRVLQVAVAVVLAVLVFSGSLSIAREAGLHWRLYDANDLQLAEWAQSNTSRSAVFLTSTAHNHPVSSLAGRMTVLGYPGWLWSHGFDYGSVQADAKAMYAGDAARLESSGVDYVVVDANVRRDYAVNDEFFSGKPVAFQNAFYRVYAVGTRTSSNR